MTNALCVTNYLFEVKKVYYVYLNYMECMLLNFAILYTIDNLFIFKEDYSM